MDFLSDAAAFLFALAVLSVGALIIARGRRRTRRVGPRGDGDPDEAAKKQAERGREG